MQARRSSRLKEKRGFMGFAELPRDAWTTICESLGPDGVVAERTSHLFVDCLRDRRVSLKLPKMYDCRSVNGMIVDGSYKDERYAKYLIEIVNRYSNLRVLDATRVWDGCNGSAWDDDPYALEELLFSMYDGPTPTPDRIILQPRAHLIVRYMLECERGVQIEPALSHEAMTFLAAGKSYGYGENSAVKIQVENEYITRRNFSAHFYDPVRVTTPGGTRFEIKWQQKSAGLAMDGAMMDFAELHPDSPALGPDGDDLDWEHPEFQQFCDEQEEAILKDWARRLKHWPFLLLLGADNGCNADCCKIKIIPGEDLRTCSCEHKRPIFVPKGYDDVVHHNDMVQVEYGGALACICEVSDDFLPWCVPCASSDSEED